MDAVIDGRLYPIIPTENPRAFRVRVTDATAFDAARRRCATIIVGRSPALVYRIEPLQEVAPETVMLVAFK